jgi:ribosome-binding factor A
MKRHEQRVSKLIKQEISSLLERKVNDPRLKNLVSVTEVRLSPDIKYAKVFVSILGNEADKKEMLAGFNAASSFLQRELASRIRLKHIPQLSFCYDDSIEREAKLLGLIEQVSNNK